MLIKLTRLIFKEKDNGANDINVGSLTALTLVVSFADLKSDRGASFLVKQVSS